jgi:hypothetical protein
MNWLGLIGLSRAYTIIEQGFESFMITKEVEKEDSMERKVTTTKGAKRNGQKHISSIMSSPFSCSPTI